MEGKKRAFVSREGCGAMTDEDSLNLDWSFRSLCLHGVQRTERERHIGQSHLDAPILVSGLRSLAMPGGV